MKPHTLSFLFSLGLMLGAAGAADAAVINFDGIAAPGSFTSYGTGPLTLSGVTFTGNGSMFVVDPGFYGSSYANGGFLTSDYTVGGDVINVALPDTHQVSFDFGGLLGSPVDFTLSASDGQIFNISSTNSILGGSLSHFSFTSAAGVTSLVFSMPDSPNYNAIDNFQFGAVPEPVTWALFIIGFGAIGGVLRTSRRFTSAA
jgi:hypothetical protein